MTPEQKQRIEQAAKELEDALNDARGMFSVYVSEYSRTLRGEGRYHVEVTYMEKWK